LGVTLYDLLNSDDPVALRRIEKVLSSEDDPNDTTEAVISALIWQRCTAGHNGVLGAVLNHECAARISVLANHLEQVGASDAARAMRKLRGEIPLEDAQIAGGIIDWVDVNPTIASHAAALDEGVDDISSEVWSYMQERQSDFPDHEIPDKRKGLFGALFG